MTVLKPNMVFSHQLHDFTSIIFCWLDYRGALLNLLISIIELKQRYNYPPEMYHLYAVFP